MRLQYLVANAAYVVTFGDSIIHVEGAASRFFGTRQEAVEALRRRGLTVARNGEVSVAA